jgi:Spy/CpxP family protein refolding chaperone
MKAFQTWRGRLQALTLAVVAVGVVTVANVAARQPAPGRPNGPGMRPPFPFAQLNLTDDQKTRIEAIFEKHRTQEQATREQLRTAHESLRTAIFGSATPDAAQIEQLTSQLVDLEGQTLKARIATEIEVASVLNDEQRQKMATMQGPGPRRGPRR